MFICARLSTWKTPMRIALAAACRRRPDRPAGRRRGRSRRPPCWRIRSNALRMQVSMPSASTSTFISPSASMSSLSHSMKVRSSIAALPIGTISSSRPRVSTKPPTCCERWRGKPSSRVAKSTRAADHRIVGIEPGLADMRSSRDVAAPAAPLRRGERAVTSSVRPSALPTSRMALRGR